MLKLGMYKNLRLSYDRLHNQWRVVVLNDYNYTGKDRVQVFNSPEERDEWIKNYGKPPVSNVISQGYAEGKPNLKLSYWKTKNLYVIIVLNDARYSGDILRFDTEEERQEWIDGYEEPLENGDGEIVDNGDEEPTPPAVKASYGLLLLAFLLAGLAYVLWR